MKKVTTTVLDQAVVLKAEGKSNKEIMGALNLSHSQLERHLLTLAVEAGNHGGFLPQPESLTVKAALIADLRLKGQSWGLISIRFKEPESRTRKDFAEASGMNSKGMRIGKGGRYVSDDQRFYTGSDRAKLGSELFKGTPIHDQLPTDYDEVPIRVLPTLVQPGKAVVKRVRKPKVEAKA